MLVSIITPVLNGARYIAETLESIRAQSHGNIEHIVVDGGSTDETIPILRRYSHCSLLLEGSDRGMYDAINKGLGIARGDVLAYLNCDDLYYPDTVKRCIDFLSMNPETAMVYGDLDLIDSHTRFIARYRCPDFDLKLFASIGWILTQPTFFWRRRVCEKAGGFNADLKLLGDYEFFLRVGKEFRVERVAGLHARFRVHPDSLTATQTDKYRNEIVMIRKVIHPDIPRLVSPLDLALAKFKIKFLNTPMYIQKLRYRLKMHAGLS